MTVMRTLAGSATMVLALSLSACGGGGSGAPDDASAEEFCGAYNSLFEHMSDVDPEASADERAEAGVEMMKDWAKEMEDTGTPEDMSDEAREGFELIVDTASDIDADDLENLEDMEGEFSGDEQDAAKAFQTYVGENCDSPLGDLPSDLPTE